MDLEPICRVPLITSSKEQQMLINSSTKPVVKLLINRHNSKYSYTKNLLGFLGCCLAILLLACAEASYRHRRQSQETTYYQPPLHLSSTPQPIPMQNYQPPKSRQQQQATNNFEHRSPLEYASSGQHQSFSYVPHDSSQTISVHQQPASSERTSKVIESSASLQTIHKAPASEIEAKKESLAKEKDAAKAEYVIYYYYYYDNDTTAGSTSSSNFDDIPSLESYDDTKLPEKIQTNVGNAVDDSSTSTTATPTRRTFQGNNRIRSRPSIGSRSNNNEDRSASRSTTESPATTTTAQGRFSSAAPLRRFQSSRSRSQSSSSTTSTTTTTRSPHSRSRPATSRPRPNLISRNRPSRPGFLRPKPEEVVETTTPTPAEPEETSPPSKNEYAATAEEDSEESEETSEEEEESEPTTTEYSRFSALFRPRNRNALSRPRPVFGNRPSRS